MKAVDAVVGSARRPRRVLLVGPDGTGKSTVSAELADRLASRSLDVVTGHYRPGLLWKRSPTPTTEPHAQASRPSAAAVAKVLAVYGDFVLGYVGPWKLPSNRAQAFTGGARDRIVILERGWWDHVVDPVRYRLPDQAVFVIRLLGRTLPKADLVVILSGDADAVVARKPELRRDEIQRQLEAWHRVAPLAGHEVIEIDTVASTVDEVTQQLLRRLAIPNDSGTEASPGSPESVLPESVLPESVLPESVLPKSVLPGSDALGSAMRWREVLGAPRRVGLRATEGAGGVAAMAIYQPMSSAAKLAGRASAVLVKRRMGPVTIPPAPDLSGLFAGAGFPRIDGMASMTSSTSGRVIVGAAVGNSLVAVAKVGEPGDASLVNEGEVLRRLNSVSPSGFVVPELCYAGSWQGRPTVVAAAMGQSPVELSLNEVLAVAVGLANIDGAFLTHGDLAPWNLRAQGDRLVLLDFEHAVWQERPLADLAHYLVQTGALLGERSPVQTWSELCDPGRLGRRYLAAIGVDAKPGPLVADYVERQLASGRASTAEEQTYLRQLGAQHVRSP